ncbi:DUF2306 domain-containing protein [Terribacillus sp. AE2B 122]|jgi:uncharacterized membrane protein|uniref:DUF2306 domain-containing protein n=1 Tax=Terribacillus sp. AE2B 122 TaxID=1331902 RepID=UPI001582907C|nr:DUF2306 domain-containing protein [Terribacillus sp. AE2B 122]
MILKRIRLGVVTLLAIGIAGYSVVQYGFVGLDKAGMVMQKISSGEVLSDMWRIMLSIHIATSIFALVLGPFLLLDSIRQKNKVLHKRMGYIYTAGVIGGGITGLYLAYYASGGTFAKIGFALMAITWLVTVFFAVKAATQKKNSPASTLDNGHLQCDIRCCHTANLVRYVYVCFRPSSI